MKKNTTHTVTCGLVPSSPSDEDSLMTFTLASVKEVKDAASRFIKVIPDELDFYRDQIASWEGKDRLVLSHQDDDYFIFIAAPASPSGLPEAFAAFVADYAVDDDEEEEESDED